jgi:hypothetical protein
MAGQAGEAAQKDRDARWTVKFSKAKLDPDGKAKQRDIAVPVFGYKNHAAIDRRHGFIRGWSVTSAAGRSSATCSTEREGTLREKIRTLCRPSLLVVDEIGYLPVTPGGGNLLPHLQSRLCGMGRGIWRSRRRHGAARPPASPRRRRADRRGELSHAPAR